MKKRQTHGSRRIYASRVPIVAMAGGAFVQSLRVNLYIRNTSLIMKKKKRVRKNIPEAQTTRVALFEPTLSLIIVIVKRHVDGGRR
jgi:hypothetical protein